MYFIYLFIQQHWLAQSEKKNHFWLPQKPGDSKASRECAELHHLRAYQNEYFI